MAELAFNILLGILALATAGIYAYKKHSDYWYRSKESMHIQMYKPFWLFRNRGLSDIPTFVRYIELPRSSNRSKYAYLTHKHYHKPDRNYINNQLGITLGVF